jgi:hypothetical protein
MIEIRINIMRINLIINIKNRKKIDITIANIIIRITNIIIKITHVRIYIITIIIMAIRNITRKVIKIIPIIIIKNIYFVQVIILI